ncbi:MAG: hypothetical protein LBN22_03225 [Clostridiales Family XIII bacterium]|jgi:hypothetical protein|nr:hypothetical protein [Clostridiales Family XIII bacterium]
MENQMNPIADAINIVSGMVAAPFVDALHEICEDESLQGICHAITALGEESRTLEAVQLVRALLDICKMDCPDELAELEENEMGSTLFIKEFIADLNDILYSV